MENELENTMIMGYILELSVVMNIQQNLKSTQDPTLRNSMQLHNSWSHRFASSVCCHYCYYHCYRTALFHVHGFVQAVEPLLKSASTSEPSEPNDCEFSA